MHLIITDKTNYLIFKKILCKHLLEKSEKNHVFLIEEVDPKPMLIENKVKKVGF